MQVCARGMLQRPKTKNFLAPKFGLVDCNISSEENSEYPAEKSNGEGTSQRWKDGRCEMVLYKCTKASLVTQAQRSLPLQDRKRGPKTCTSSRHIVVPGRRSRARGPGARGSRPGPAITRGAD